MSRELHLSGSFSDSEHSCRYCEYFCLWGTNIGYCPEEGDDVVCSDVCDNFKPYDDVKKTANRLSGKDKAIKDTSVRKMLDGKIGEFKEPI